MDGRSDDDFAGDTSGDKTLLVGTLVQALGELFVTGLDLDVGKQLDPGNLPASRPHTECGGGLAGVALNLQAVHSCHVEVAQVMTLDERCRKELFGVPLCGISVERRCGRARKRGFVRRAQGVGPGVGAGCRGGMIRLERQVKLVGVFQLCTLPMSSRPASEHGFILCT